MSSNRFRVLIIDDTVALRGLLNQAIEADSRFAVVGAVGDGKAGVRAAVDLQPDVIVLDLAMPEMDGIEALPQLRDAAPHARVVVLSGFRRAPFAATLLKGGVVGYLEKGVTAPEFRRELLAVLGALDVIEPLIASTRTDLSSGTSSPGQARRFVAAFLNDHTVSGLEDVALLVSELVTNAVSHTNSAPQIVVQVTSSILRVEVHDDSPDLPTPREPDAGSPGGRGLHLLADLALEWGTERRPGGKAVWFHYPLGPTTASR